MKSRHYPSRRFAASAVALGVASLLGSMSAHAQEQPSQGPTGQGAVPTGGSGAVVVPAKPAPNDATKLQVTPPHVVHFEQAPYPPEAEKAGVQADVVLQLDVDRDGKVTKATAIQKAGHGFDEAAEAAALKFTFEPAHRGDTPVPARILYRYSFTLRPAEPEQAKSAQPANVGVLTGAIRSNDGDMPLAGVAVHARDATGRERVVTTGDDGKWTLSDLAPGIYALDIQSPGYESLALKEEVVAGSSTEVVYRLVPTGSGIEVTVRGSRPPREVTRRTLEQREISRIPGTNGDALRSLQNLPGIARPPGLAGLLIVRGSAPQDTQTFVDGAYVPLVYHFGGLSSVVPTEMLDKIDFYPGNFSAQYGRVMGGIVDVNLRSPNPDGKYHGMAQVDLIDARMIAEGPVPLLKGWSFLVGARRSWVDIWLKPVLNAADSGVTAAPVYYDYQALVETNPTPRSSLRFAAYGSDDRLELLIKDPSEQDPALGGSLGFRTGFWRVQGLYRNDITDSLKYTALLGYGLDRLDFNVGGLYFNLRLHPIVHRSEFSARLSPGVTLHAGVDIQYTPYDVDLRLPPPPRPGEPNPGPFATKPPLTVSESGVSSRPAGYFEAEISPSDRVKLIPGVRVDYTSDSGHWDLSPRVNGRYDIVHEFPRTTIKAGFGVFNQPPQFQETDRVFGTPHLYSNRAIHYSLGAEQELSRHVELSVEGFYKDLDQLVARVPNDAGGYDYNNAGSGYVVGSEVLLKYKPDARFFGWLAYTISRSTRNEPPTYATTLFQYDQTHILTVLGSYQLGHGWEFGARYRLVSGNLDTPNIGGIYNNDAGAYAPVSGAPFSSRLPLFHQLDLRVDKLWRLEGWNLRAYLDVQNVYNRSNPEAATYNYNFTQQTTIAFLPIIPSLGIRGEF